VRTAGPGLTTGRRRLAAAFGAFALALLAVMTLAQAVLSDRTWWSECLAIWPPLLWVLPPLACGLVARLLGGGPWLRAVLAATAVALLVTVEWRSLLRRADADQVERWEAARSGGGASGPLALRVVTWNVSRERVLPRLSPLRPDLCLFQESAAPSREDLAHPSWSGHVWHGGDDPGTLSRWPATVLPTEKVGPWTPPLLLRVDAPGDRRILVANARLVLPELVLAAVSPSDPHDLIEGHRRRVAQYDKLAALLARTEAAERPSAVVLCGDFNIPANAASLAPLRRTYLDVWAGGGLGWGGTMGEDLPLARIDQCWVSSGVGIVRARVNRGQPSDHRMLVADLLIP
jgi:endonuclease/exonuclease/phosphatase (EEP) superfamily protein YafD